MLIVDDSEDDGDSLIEPADDFVPVNEGVSEGESELVRVTLAVCDGVDAPLFVEEDDPVCVLDIESVGVALGVEVSEAVAD